MDRRRKSTFLVQRKVTLMSCIIAVFVSNALMLIYYILNPTRKLLNQILPIGFIFSRLAILVVICVIIFIVFFYFLKFVKLISVLGAFIITIEIIFGFYFVLIFVMRIDNFFNENNLLVVDSTLQNRLENIYGCCFHSPQATSQSPTPYDATVSMIPARSGKTTASSKYSIHATEFNKCSYCPPAIKEHARNIATLFSTGFIFNVISTSMILVLLIIYKLNLKVSQ